MESTNKKMIVDKRAAQTIRVKIFADLRRFQEPEIDYRLNGSTAISSILDNLKIPRQKVTIIFVNGKHANPGDCVAPGDVLSLFPPVGGG
jgi:molybdopterin synthase sulfur carrier subunit